MLFDTTSTKINIFMCEIIFNIIEFMVQNYTKQIFDQINKVFSHQNIYNACVYIYIYIFVLFLIPMLKV